MLLEHRHGQTMQQPFVGFLRPLTSHRAASGCRVQEVASIPANYAKQWTATNGDYVANPSSHELRLNRMPGRIHRNNFIKDILPINDNTSITPTTMPAFSQSNTARAMPPSTQYPSRTDSARPLPTATSRPPPAGSLSSTQSKQTASSKCLLTPPPPSTEFHIRDRTHDLFYSNCYVNTVPPTLSCTPDYPLIETDSDFDPTLLSDTQQTASRHTFSPEQLQQLREQVATCNLLLQDELHMLQPTPTEHDMQRDASVIVPPPTADDPSPLLPATTNTLTITLYGSMSQMSQLSSSRHLKWKFYVTDVIQATYLRRCHLSLVVPDTSFLYHGITSRIPVPLALPPSSLPPQCTTNISAVSASTSEHLFTPTHDRAAVSREQLAALRLDRSADSTHAAPVPSNCVSSPPRTSSSSADSTSSRSHYVSSPSCSDHGFANHVRLPPPLAVAMPRAQCSRPRPPTFDHGCFAHQNTITVNSTWNILPCTAVIHSLSTHSEVTVPSTPKSSAAKVSHVQLAVFSPAAISSASITLSLSRVLLIRHLLHNLLSHSMLAPLCHTANIKLLPDTSQLPRCSPVNTLPIHRITSSTNSAPLIESKPRCAARPRHDDVLPTDTPPPSASTVPSAAWHGQPVDAFRASFPPLVALTKTSRNGLMAPRTSACHNTIGHAHLRQQSAR
ncbi:mucin-5AC-like [Schistocerca nitens]|uniref:mucin-5AC-like n=1 Tax=Schistocerca nitens TaxID=7011 RepID=UPI0021181396|nr:mucin-5AC-like [Schistocerca nitens]